MLGLMLATVVGVFGASMTVSFDYDFTDTQLCSATVTMDCLDHFEFGTWKNSVFGVLTTIPIPAGASGKMQGIGSTFPVTKFGSAVYAAIAVAKDSTGARITSDPAAPTANITVVIVPRPPTNLSAN